MKIKLAIISIFVLLVFTLQAQSTCKTELRFGLMTDIQYCSSPSSGTRYYQNSLSKVRQIVTEFNKENVDFTIHLGDLIDRDARSYDSILPIVRKLKTAIYFAYGNHDFNVSESYKLRIDSIHSQRHSYYSFQKNGWRLIVLNTNDISSYAYPAGSANKLYADSLIKVLKLRGKVEAHPWNGGVGSKQLKWLESELENATKKRQLVAVFGHHPIYPPAADNVLNDTEISELLGKFSCAKAYFCGHSHAGNFATKNNIYFFNQKGVVETPQSNAYSIVELTTDSIRIKGFEREINRILPIK
jgi:predicted phosphodiesterase